MKKSNREQASGFMKAKETHSGLVRDATSAVRAIIYADTGPIAKTSKSMNSGKGGKSGCKNC